MGCGASAGGRLDLVSPTENPELKLMLEQHHAAGVGQMEDKKPTRTSGRGGGSRPDSAASGKKMGAACVQDPGEMVAEPGVRTGPYESNVHSASTYADGLEVTKFAPNAVDMERNFEENKTS
mmetsp:Transcript_36204/g.85834  ORF Transcript_36204/g.85834 Transcript_36204/m.85834 type:complete len:122 (+) Transcript_36204:217-582(+)|eukprot:CAMPEP_0177727552 /NCGR_PEP_ID=MMETSP0484_2-20121128/20387_1 /TAXON_ID=354590 /ORGANISM="Rhodomonas lens, Strain RHODO" /LENGTH=121 /DNA_ID=CAMNT_0019240223 /DNA_START=193 /DNA_END=558 /DNA_ORIENTATION=-